jgi:hypothetical protein
MLLTESVTEYGDSYTHLSGILPAAICLAVSGVSADAVNTRTQVAVAREDARFTGMRMKFIVETFVFGIQTLGLLIKFVQKKKASPLVESLLCIVWCVVCGQSARSTA